MYKAAFSAHNPRRTTIVGIALAITFSVGLASLLHARVALSEQIKVKRPLPVAVTTFHQQASYTRKASFLGLVEAGRKADLGFELPGLITGLAVREGTAVAAGDTLASLDNATLLASKKATEAELKRVKIELKLANIKAQRQQNLSKTGAVSKEAFDETRLRALALTAQVDGVIAQLQGIDIELKKSVLKAPYDGVIADRYVDKGSIVTPGMPVVRLIESGYREAYIGVPVEQLRQLSTGEQYTLRFQGQALVATLVSVRPDINPITRTSTAVFALPTELGALHGEPISLELELPVAISGGWLPLAALLEGQRGIWNVLRVTVTDSGHSTVREIVEVMEVQGDKAYVRGTLVEGNTIIAKGIHRLTPGLPVAIAES